STNWSIWSRVLRSSDSAGLPDTSIVSMCARASARREDGWSWAASAKRYTQTSGWGQWSGPCLGPRGGGRTEGSAPRHVGISGNVPAPWSVDGRADADSGRAYGIVRWRHAVVKDCDASVRADEVGAVVRTVETKCLAQLAGPAAKIAISFRRRAGGVHGVDALDRSERSEQHGGRHPVAATHHVGAPVHSVAEVHVQVAGRTEH